MSVQELRDELRALRREKQKPVSKMRKSDISAEIQRLRLGREETPASASISSAPSRKMRSEAESIRRAKETEFPVAPEPRARSSRHMMEPERHDEPRRGTTKGEVRKTARRAYEDLPSHKEEPKPRGGRVAKGSEEARERMARIREMRHKKPEAVGGRLAPPRRMRDEESEDDY